MLLNYKGVLFKRRLQLFFRVVKEENSLMWGMGNRCENGEYILFLDYDDTPIEWIMEEVRLLQELFMGDLSDAYLFKTKHGTHVLFLDKHPVGMIIRMMDATTCDKHYKNIPMMYGRKLWVLRQSPKKNEEMKYLGVLTAKNRCIYERSSAHKNYIQQMFRIPERDFHKPDINYGRWDGMTKISFGYYRIHEE